MYKLISAIGDDYNAVTDIAAGTTGTLENAGIRPEDWTPAILAPADQIHGGGLTQKCLHAELTTIRPDTHLIDIGCGIGGPARYFATEFGCRVMGIDLTPEYIDSARKLPEMMGLSDLVSFDVGDAAELPYDDEAFDMAWALNVTMNIEDREKFYTGVRRVLKPGASFGISELGRGPGGEPYYPLTWARDPSYSFLLPPDEMRRVLESCGFRVVEWVDEAARRQASETSPPPPEPEVNTPLTIEITRGADYPDRRKNSGRSAKEGRLTNVMLVAEKI
jgi:MPBQ/MSBQ methyltransferase